MKNYDFCITHFHSLRHYKQTLSQINYIQKNKYKPLLVVNSKTNENFFRKKFKNLRILNVFISKKELKKNIDYFFEFEKIKNSYSIEENLLKFVNVEKIQSSVYYNSDKIIFKKCILLFKKYEEFFKENYCNYFYQILASELDRRVFYYIGKKFGKQTFYYTDSLLPERSYIILDNEQMESRLVQNSIQKKFEINNIKDELSKKFINYKNNNTYLIKKTSKLMDKIEQLPNFFERLLLLDPFKYVLKISVKIQYIALRFLLKNFLFSKIVSNDKFIFYPLHQPKEAQILIRAFPYYNEYDLIERISLSIPNGFYLYVKMHPKLEHEYDFYKLYKISKLQNIKIIKTEVNSFELIKKSKLNIVINSTVWMESLLLNRPILVLGNGIFDNGLQEIKINNLKNLSFEISKILNNGQIISNLDYFFSSLWDNSFKMIREKNNLTFPTVIFDNVLKYIKNNEVLRQK